MAKLDVHNETLLRFQPLIDYEDAEVRKPGVYFERINIDSNGIISLIGGFRVRWDLFIMFLTLYNCFEVPFVIGFEIERDLKVILNIIELVIDFIFAIDIYLNCKTSYFDPRTKKEIKEPKKVKFHYLKSRRFVLDIISCLPIGITRLITTRTLTYSVFKLAKLARILRLNKIIYYMRIKQDIKLPLRIGKTLIFVLMYLHYLTCSWRRMIEEHQEWQPPSSAFDPSFNIYDIGKGQQYSICFYYAVGTLVGMEIIPNSIWLYIVCSIFFLLGALLFTYILGEITDLISNLYEDSREFTRAMDSILSLMHYFKLKNTLQVEILDYFKSNYHLFKRNQTWADFKRRLPEEYLVSINLALYTSAVISQPALGSSREGSYKFIRKLDFQFIMPSQTIIKMMDASKEFFIVLEGTLQVMVEGLDRLDHLVRKLHTSDYCGEVGILYNQPRTATVFSLSYCTVGVIKKENFTDILKKHQAIDSALRERISKYDDPYKTQVIKMMKKIPYFKIAKPVTLDKLFYSMKHVDLHQESVIFEEGAKTAYIYFVIQGSVIINAGLYDFDLQKRMITDDNLENSNIYRNRKLSMTLKKKLGKHESVKKRFDLDKRSILGLCKLKEGSIMCATQVLFEKTLNVNCYTNKNTRMLLLKYEDILALIPEDIRLRIGIMSIINRYHTYLPEFDYYKKFTKEHKEHKRKWKAVKLWKRAILMVIMANRRIEKPKIEFLLHRMTKITRITQKDKVRRAQTLKKKNKIDKIHKLNTFSQCEVLRKNENRNLFLNYRDKYVPIMAQFGNICEELYSYKLDVDTYLHRGRTIVTKSMRRRERIKVKIQELVQIFGLLNDYF